MGPELLAKMLQNMQVWFGDLDFGTFCLVSWDLVHTFQNRFLHWNRELKLVILSTMNLINGTFFFLVIKGSVNIKGGQVCNFSTTKQFNTFCNVFIDQIWPENVREQFLLNFYAYKGGATSVRWGKTFLMDGSYAEDKLSWWVGWWMGVEVCLSLGRAW